MFKVEIMRKTDFTFAVNLSNTMGWNMTPQDFAFNCAMEPEGCFVLREDSEQVGIATCISYGKTGWFGNLIVKEENRRKGAGLFLLRHAVDYLHRKGVETVGLYAYPKLVGFYGKAGFDVDVDFLVLHAENPAVTSKETPTRVDSKTLAAVVDFDRACFGGDRKRLLEVVFLDHGNLGYYVSEGNSVVGFVGAKDYAGMAELGPLVCEPNRPDVALKLVKAVLSRLGDRAVYLYLPKHQTALHNYLYSIGFKEQFSLTRMFLTRNPLKNCIYIAESLERG